MKNTWAISSSTFLFVQISLWFYGQFLVSCLAFRCARFIARPEGAWEQSTALYPWECKAELPLESAGRILCTVRDLFGATRNGRRERFQPRCFHSTA